MKPNQITRKSMLAVAAVLYGFAILTGSALGQGTAFTYQGQLQSSGAAANGIYDFTFAIFNGPTTNATQIGRTLPYFGVGVTNGVFTVTLDFGPAFTGSPTWLAINVRSNGTATFTPLSPLQQLTPAPYAIYAPNAGTATSVTGSISISQIPSNILINGETNITLSGSFSGDGSGLSNVTGTAAFTAATNVTNIYSANGTNSFVIPAGTTQMVVKLWGAGGANASFAGVTTSGGGGAFSEVTEIVSPGQTYVVVVGQSGSAGGAGSANDASGGAGNSFGSFVGGAGGQASSLFLYNGQDYIMQAVAGGGGGANLSGTGGAGQAAGSSSGYAAGATTTGVTNLDVIGGDGGAGSNTGGGGGGGYSGGNGGSAAGGTGGGSYGATTVSGNGGSPGNSSDPNYVAGTGGNGENGAAVVIMGDVALETFPAAVSAPAFYGNGIGLTNLNASNLSGTISAGALGMISGDYTPTIGDGTHNFTTTTQKGYYQKFGNQVYFEAWLVWSSKGSASGNLVVSLPFTNQSSRPAFNFGYMANITNATQILGDSEAGLTNFTVAFTSTSGGAVAPVQVSNCGASGEIQVTGTYRWQ